MILHSTHAVVTTKWKRGDEIVTMLVNFKGYVCMISTEDMSEAKQIHDCDCTLFI